MENSNFGKYLKDLRLLKGYSINKLSLKSNVSNAHISRLERGVRSVPSPDVIKKLAKALEADYRELFKKAGYLPENIEKPQKNSPSSKSYFKDDFVLVPVYSEISAQHPVPENGNILRYEYIRKEDARGGKCFFLEVRGDYMIDIRIKEGDLILVRCQDILKNGQIGMIIVQDQIFISRFYKQESLIILKPENSAYQPIVVPSSKLKIVGEVIEAKIRFSM